MKHRNILFSAFLIALICFGVPGQSLGKSVEYNNSVYVNDNLNTAHVNYTSMNNYKSSRQKQDNHFGISAYSAKMNNDFKINKKLSKDEIKIAALRCIGDQISQRNIASGSKWCKIAAEHGDQYGEYYLGSSYANGQGVPQSYKKARRWYRLSAQQGNQFAAYNLGLLYLNGQGVPKSYTKASHWFLLSADKNDDKAEVALGDLYLQGRGVLNC